MKGKSIVVTGGGGSIGSEICDRGDVRSVTIANRRECRACAPCCDGKSGGEISDAVIEGRIADIRDRAHIMHLMAEFKPDVVFHALL